MPGQTLPRTHQPFVEMVDSLTSPGGGLFWDILLLALGIFVEVVVLQQYFDRQGEKRCRSAKRYLYRQPSRDAPILWHCLVLEKADATRFLKTSSSSFRERAAAGKWVPPG